MFYEEYEQKILKIKKIRDTILKYKFLILGVLVAIFALYTGFALTKGRIVDDLRLSSEYVYGEEIDYNAKAFWASVRYRYRACGSRKWKEGTPDEAGEYEVYAVAKNGFGIEVHGDVKRFFITPKTAEIYTPNTVVVYGETPEVAVRGLIGTDKLDKTALQFSGMDFQDENATVSIVEGSLKIVDGKGKEKTHCYDFGDTMYEMIDVKLRARDITIVFENAEKTYDGEPLFCEKWTLKETLAYEDALRVQEFCSLTDAGEAENTAEVFSVQNKNGQDVSRWYNISVKKGKLTVKKRTISLRTETGEKTYDGTPLQRLGFDVTDGSWVNGHQATVREATELTNVGNVENTLQFCVTDTNGEDKTFCYDVKQTKGILTVTARPICVRTVELNKIYNGKTLSQEEAQYSVEAVAPYSWALVDGHEVLGVEFPTAVDVGEYDNEIVVKVCDSNGTNLSKNYNITYKYGKFCIEKRPVTIRLKDMSRPYDGTKFTRSDYEIIGEYGLVSGHLARVTANGGIVEIGSVANRLESVAIYQGSKDVSYNYDIQKQDGTLSIVKRKIKITPLPLTKEYDGTALAYPAAMTAEKCAYATWQDEVDKAYGAALYQGCFIRASVRVGALTRVGTTDISLVDCRVYDAAGMDVTTKYYEIESVIGQGSITQRKLVVASQDVQKIDDGKTLVGGSEHCWIAQGGLVGGAQISYVVDASIGEVGSAVNQIVEVTIKENGRVVGYLRCDRDGAVLQGNSANYDYVIELDCGSLTILEKENV